MNYFVILELIFCAVFSYEALRGETSINSPYMLMLLVYACLKLFFYIIYDKKASRLLSVFILILTGIGSWFVYPMTIFFPLCLNQVNAKTANKGWWISLLSLAWLFVLPPDFILPFILSFGISTIIVQMQMENAEALAVYDKRVDSLQRNQSRMKEQLETYTQINQNISYQSQLEERNKLSQALHDELGHTLSGNILRLEAIKVVLDKDTDKSKNMMQEVIDNLRNGMNSIRAILKAAKPELSTVNIANLKLIIDNVKKQTDVKINLKYTSDISVINQNMWQAIIPNVKEALTNMMKYSKAENCCIEFTKLNKLYRVSVKDDGMGCKSIDKGLGMIGIEERMALIKGHAIFDSTDGFSVTMIFPINTAEQGASK